MASLFQKPGSKVFHCCFKNSNGKWTYVSTRQKDEGKARLVCDSLQKVADDYREKLRPISYLKKMLNSIAALVGGETIEDYTFRTWSAAYLADQEAASAEGTYARYRQIFHEFLEHLGDRADVGLTEITAEDIRSFRDTQVKAGISNAAANVILKAIRSCLNLAFKQGHVEYNRAEAVKLLGRVPTIKKPFARVQVEQLLSLAKGEWRGLILAGYFIGARLGTLVKLMREQVDFETSILNYTPNKQRRSSEPKTVIIPLHPQVMAYLCESSARKGPVFPESSGRTVSKLSASFRKLLEATGIECPVKKAKGKKGRTVYALGFHSLRKAFNTDLANSHVSQEIRQKLIGHASKEVNDLYTVLEMETLRSAIAQLENLTPSSPPTEPPLRPSKPPNRRARQRKRR